MTTGTNSLKVNRSIYN